VEDGAEPLAALAAGGHGERHATLLDALLGPADAPGHGRLGHQERPGDLRGGQAADRPQGQRDLRRRRQDGVTAHEQQDERVVGLRRRPVGGGRQPLPGKGPAGDAVLAALAGLLAAEQVGEPARGDRDQPAPRVVRDAAGGPLHGRRQERLLGGVLGGVEVPVAPDHRAEDLRRQPPQQVLGLGVGHGTGQSSRSVLESASGRTSATAVAATSGGAGQLARRPAISVARSKLSHSTIQ